MKFLKWLLIGVCTLVLILGVGIAALVYLMDWNKVKDTIQNQVKKQTGRDLIIAGDLEPSVFPWAGVSISDITLANAEGFGSQPFAAVGSADVKVELLPLIKRVVNVRTVDLNGLSLDLQRAADGTTNWDDLVNSTSTTSQTTDEGGDEEVITEVEGSSATIAALEVGGINISNANVSWNDAQGGTDAALTAFNLSTGAIELEKPFNLSTDFKVSSKSMDLQADIKGAGELVIDLNNQVYSLNGFTLDTTAVGGSLPGGKIEAKLGADVTAMLADQQIDLKSLTLSALGIDLKGVVNVTELNTEPQITGTLETNTFSPKELLAKLGMEPLVTADENVLTAASLSLALAATPASAALNDLTIKLDDTTFSGEASVPSLDSAIPPLRFDFGVDAIDIDRYLPPVVEGEEPAEEEEAPTTDAPPVDGDAPIELPTEMLRQLDVDGVFRVGSVKVSNLTTSDIVVPMKAKGGKLALEGVSASLYEGKLDATASMDASGEVPGYGVKMSLDGIQADPLLADLLQDDSFLSGGGAFAADITTGGNSVNALTSGLNGGFNTAFTDGSINGINIGYQIRRAKAALTGKKLDADEASVKTDFSSFNVSGTFTNGVMNSDDLDMRSPLLRLGGAGKVDLPGEVVDYTLTTLITGSAQGQGGSDLDSLKGVKLNIPIQGTFDALAADFAGVILKGMKDSVTGNLKNQAKALADEQAEKLKGQLKEQEAAAKAKLKEQEAAAKAKLKEQAEAEINKAKDKAKNKLKGLLGN